MKGFTTILFVVLFAVGYVFVGFESAYAQDPDTLDVEPGYETLNLAVEGDTTETGEPKNPNRVYRLARGGAYLLNGNIRTNSGTHMRVVAAKGDGPLPMLIPAADETGSAQRAFRLYGPGTFKELYITGVDNLGNFTKNMFRAESFGSRIIIDKCFLDYDVASFVRLNVDSLKLYITNTIARNSGTLPDPNQGRFFGTRGNTLDSAFVQNSTIYRIPGDVLRDGNGLQGTMVYDHVTFYQTSSWGSNIDIEHTVNLTFTNNLIIDFGWSGDLMRPSDPADTTLTPFINIDTLNAPGIASDAERMYKITNNVYGWTPAIQAWIDSRDSLYNYPFLNKLGMLFINTYDNMVFDNNIMEVPVFSDPPPDEDLVEFARHRINTGFSDEGNPDFWADRNGRAALADDPLSVGPAADEFDFDYNTDAVAYTHAEGGFPVGDLNWFPDKKKEWEAWVVTGVKSARDGSQPTRFTLDQNYPNPFNPETTILYHLNSSSVVKLTVYNAIGQRVRELVGDKRQVAGDYTVQWDGLTDAGLQAASGLYVYRLEADNQVQVKKMLLMR